MLSLILAAAAALAPAPAPAAWVELAPGGSVVRVVTPDASCPVITVDGHARRTVLRAGPASVPERANKAGVAGPLVFDTRVCELPLSRRVRSASLAGVPLALPRPHIDRVLLIGDTGCRMKGSEDFWQACNDPAQWPFAAIAARAARLHPDLVLHVGDYLYRENACPAAQAGCTGSAWGYGDAGWRADFLDPAAPLLRAAPWIMVRGNHEECARAGQGWWRLLDPHPLHPGSDCNQAGDDLVGNHAAPYAVALGGGAQILVSDLVTLSSGKRDDPAVTGALTGDVAWINRMSAHGGTSFVTAHFPFNPVLWNGKAQSEVSFGGKPLASFSVPPLAHVRAMLAGHIHLFQYARFADRPTQIITGFSGTSEDSPIAPADMAALAGKPGAEPIRALTTITGRFGYALLQRHGAAWRMTVYAADGSVMGRFAV